MSGYNYQAFLQHNFLPYTNKKFFKKNETFTIILTLIFLLFTFFIPNNKILFLSSAIYFSAIFLLEKSIYKTLLYVFLPFSLIRVGQTYLFTVVPANIIYAQGYPYGKILDFVFSPFSLLLILSIFLLAVNLFLYFFKKKTFISFHPLILLWFLYFLFCLISSAQANFLPKLSILYTVEGFGAFVFFFLMNNFLLKSKEKFKYLNNFLLQLLIIASFISAIALLQFIKGSTLGIIIERSQLLPYFGGGADQDTSLFRPIGIFSHANILANELNILLFSSIFLAVYLKKNKKLLLKKKLIEVVFILNIFSILITLSRAVWLSLFLSGLIYLVFFPKEVKSYLRNFFKQFLKLKYFIFLLPVFWNLILRIVYSVNVLADTGAIPVRRKLFKESLILLRRNFFFGVGKGMLIPALFQENPNGVIREFPEAVHNGFLLGLVENGFFASLMLLIFYIFLFYKIYSTGFYKKNRKLLLVGFLGLFSQAIISMFHPFTNIINLYTFMILLLTYEEMA